MLTRSQTQSRAQTQSQRQNKISKSSFVSVPVETMSNSDENKMLSFVKRERTRSQTRKLKNTLCELYSNNRITRSKSKQIEDAIQLVYTELYNRKVNTRSTYKLLNEFKNLLKTCEVTK